MGWSMTPTRRFSRRIGIRPPGPIGSTAISMATAPVNDKDASILAAHWGDGMRASTLDVPEPGVLAMLVGAVAAFWVIGRRRLGR